MTGGSSPMIAGIVAEYNPFHNGHQYQLERIRRLGASHIAVVMSGNYTQRGEPALLDKWSRAKAAVLCGADLVAELPTPYATAPAADFAFSSVYLLSQLGIDTLCFGSECGDIELLSRAAAACQAAEENPTIKALLKSGFSYPRAREALVADSGNPELVPIIRQPNNMLGIEYLRAIWTVNPTIRPLTIRRIGAEHDSPLAHSHFASASFLRQMIRTQGLPRASGLLPEAVREILDEEVTAGRAVLSDEPYSRLLLSTLRRAGPEDLRTLRGITEGLEHRILHAAQDANSAKTLLEAISTKRYSNARLRRALLTCLLGIKQTGKRPQYVRILAFNSRGMDLLGRVRKSAEIPITPKFAQLAKSGFSDALFELHATGLYATLGEAIQSERQAHPRGPFIIE